VNGRDSPSPSHFIIGQGGTFLTPMKAGWSLPIAQRPSSSILRTLNLPEIARLRPGRCPTAGLTAARRALNGEILISGTADAVALNTDTTIDVVIDRKNERVAAASHVFHTERH
jgi:hypothetical protein